MKRKIDYKYNTRMYLSLFKGYWPITLFLLAIVLYLEASWVATNFLFKYVVDYAESFALNNMLLTELINALLIIAIIYIAMSAVRVIGQYTLFKYQGKAEAYIIQVMKKKLFKHIIELSHSFHVTHKTGSLISRLVRGGNAVEKITDVLIFNIFPLFFKVIITVITLLFFNINAAVITMLTVGLFIIYSIYMHLVKAKFRLIHNEKEDQEKAVISDMFANIDSIKYFGKKNRVFKKYDEATTITRNAAITDWTFYRFIDSGQGFIISTGYFLLILVSIIEFIQGSIKTSDIVLAFTVFGGLIGPLYGFIFGIRMFYDSMSDLEDLFSYTKIKNDIIDHPGSKIKKIQKGQVEFKDIHFRYGHRTIFKKLNLTIPKTKKVALVGHSGCGKTTLIKLLYRLYDVQGGNILIDGESIKSFKKESLRSEMSIVPQECALFDDTIFNNVAFSKPNATKQEVWKAIKFAQLDKIIQHFPLKEQTIVGERGVRLSGGEKQRVSIARAILADKKILVLDEATSALDSQTEHEIQKDLELLMKGRTSIIIAHRLSTIMKADIIVVMQKGKIVQMGNHKKLIKEKGQYQKLWELQKGGYIK